MAFGFGGFVLDFSIGEGMKDEPEVHISESPAGTYQGVKIRDSDGGFEISSNHSWPKIRVNKKRFKLVPIIDSKAGEDEETFEIRPK